MIREVTISSGRTLPHPTIKFSTLRTEISIRFTVSSDDKVEDKIATMQEYADRQSLKHIRNMIQEARYEES